MTITITLRRTGKVVATYEVQPNKAFEAKEQLAKLYPRHHIRLSL